MRHQYLVAVVSVAVLALWPASASAQSGYQTELTRCEKAAGAAKDAPTTFRCNWRTLVAGAPGSALTGRYTARDQHFVGTLTVIESGFGPARVGIQTSMKSSKRQCTLQASGQRINDILTVKAGTKCTIQVVSSGPNEVTLKAKDCQEWCGMGATFEGKFRLQR
jgi:hypothetical protein